MNLLINKKIDPYSTFRVDRLGGFEFKFIYYDNNYFQMEVQIYGLRPASSLWMSPLKNSSFKIGGQYDTPIYINTIDEMGVDWGYIFAISQNKDKSYSTLREIGINGKWHRAVENPPTPQERIGFLKMMSGIKEMLNYFDREPELIQRTTQMIERTKIYGEAFVSKYGPHKATVVAFQENITLLAARDPAEYGKHTAILNFANPIEPGGGVMRGANAQEESICRASNLYKALLSANAQLYYQINNRIRASNQFNSMFLGTDNVLYSPDVLVVREDVDYRVGSYYSGEELYTDRPFTVDVLTCAAPFFSGSGYILPNGDLQHLFERRIRNILETAIENGVEVIVLGAFGCGAFHNPPSVVAEAFRNVLLEERYRHAFDGIVFAVKRTSEICPVIEAFEERFSLFPNLNYMGKEKKRRESAKQYI